MWGLAFKPQTDDMRESPALTLIDELLAAGATVVAHDPVAMPEAKRRLGDRVDFAASNYEALAGADALVVVTDWNEYRLPGFRAHQARAQATDHCRRTKPVRAEPHDRDGLHVRLDRAPRHGMRVVITGAAGFLGSHLCDRFLRDEHEVIGVDNFVTGSRDNVRHLVDQRRFRLVEADVSSSIPVDEPIDGVLHFASPASPIDYYELPIETLKVGSFGTHNGLELAKRNSARFFLASTSEVYGDPLEHPQRESYWGNVNSIGPRSSTTRPSASPKP